MTRFILVLSLMLLAGSCAPQPHGGAVRPAPPGPLDIIRGGVWGDYSGLCPKQYEFCHAGRRSVCCPASRGCCEDSSGPYCCESAPHPDYRDHEWEDDDDRGASGYGCDTSDLTCSQRGQTICCSRHAGCCADDDGPYCCGHRDSRDTY
jgi:hypothetical protein